MCVFFILINKPGIFKKCISLLVPTRDRPYHITQLFNKYPSTKLPETFNRDYIADMEINNLDTDNSKNDKIIYMRYDHPISLGQKKPDLHY